MTRRLTHLLLGLAVASVLSAVAFAETLIIAQGTDAITLDPHDVTDSPTATVTSHIYETLFELQPDGSIVPHLAESYEVSEDSTTWTFTIRDGVTFHDGTPLTAEIVAGSLERFIDPDNAFRFRFLLDRIEEVSVVGPMQVQVQLATPFAPLLAHLTHNTTAIVLPSAVEEFGEAFGENPVGTGPFAFESWDRGSRVNLVTNQDYWGDVPAIDGVSFLAVPENTTRMALVESGEAHVAVRVPPQDIMRLDALDDVTVENVSSLRTIYIYFNHTLEPFTDPRVRQAFNYAVNKQDIADFVLGGAVRPSDAAIAPGIFGYTDVGGYPYDPERARELLAEAGYEDGFSFSVLTFTGDEYATVGQLMQQMFADVGLEMRLNPTERGALVDAIFQPFESTELEASLVGNAVRTGDADQALTVSYYSESWPPAANNWSFYSNERVDELIEAGRRTGDVEERRAIYAEAQEIIWNDAPWVYLVSPDNVAGVADELSGVFYMPDRSVDARGASLD